MGKPFRKEIDKSFETLAWTKTQQTEKLSAQLFRGRNLPVFIVGSGGSLSACHFAAYLFQSKGIIAKVITPLELYYYQDAIRNARVLFISASGKNSDILFAFRTAIVNEPYSLTCICMKANTKLSKLSEKYSAIAKTFEYSLPSGKDGFLATNSLVAYFGILLKTFKTNESNTVSSIDKKYLSQVEKFIQKVNSQFSFMILFGGIGHATAADIESKFVESALGDISISDYRNFAHGRHHWFAKRGKTSAIIALITPSEEKLALKTIALLPKSIPILFIQSEFHGDLASIDLLIKSFYLSDSIGQMQGIDPGRPGVPEYGRKLYNLNYASTLKSHRSDLDTIIIRKTNCRSLSEISDIEYQYWESAYKKALTALTKENYGAIVFDYDGTLCSFENRYLGLTKEVGNEIEKILSNGFIVGIATGRGRSIRTDLQKVVPKKYWDNFIIGYYNGSDIGLLSDNSKPDKSLPANKNLIGLHGTFENSDFPIKFKTELRPHQLTIELQDSINWHRIKPYIIQTVKVSNFPDIELLESTHSIDIISKPPSSKLNLLSACKQLLKSKSLPNSILSIGDKGQWPGNDYELLANPYSLSVDEVSSIPTGAWNLSKPGVKNIDALLEYLKSLQISKKGIKYRKL